MRHFRFGASVIALTAWPAVAQTAPAPAAASQSEEDIVVTATRRDQSLTSVPVAVTALSGEDLDAAVVRDTQDLARLAPGLLITTAASEATAATIRLRGIGTSGTNLGLEGSVGVFVDGVYRARSGIALADLYDVAQVEVLRGPQATLFGKNTTAGALIVRTKAPTFDWEGEAQASYGNRDAVRIMGAVGGPVSERVAFRVSGVLNKRDGYLRDVATGADANDRDRYAVRGQLRWEASPDVSFRLIADYSRKREACCGATVIANGARAPIIRALGGFVPTVLDNYEIADSRRFAANTREWGVSGQADVRLDGIAWSTILSYRDFRSARGADSDFTNLDLINTPFEDTRDRFFTAETTLRGRLGPIDWLVGAFYFDQQTGQQSAITYGADLARFFQRVFPAQALLLAPLYPVGGGDTQRNFRQSSHGWSVFTHNIVELLPGIKATIGLRYLEEDKTGSGRFRFNSPSCGRAGVPVGAQQLCPTPDFDSRFRDSKLVGTAGLSYEPSATTLAYASYSRGYKAGGLNLDRTAGLAGPAGSTFLPEEIDSYEAGVKGRFLQGKLRLGVTLFKATVKNFQQNAFTGVAFAISNAAEVNTKGVEVETSLQPARWIGFNASIVYNDAVYGSETQDSTLRGRQIVNAPKWTIQNQLRLEAPVSGRGWRPYADINARLLSDLNTSVSLIPQAEQDGYVLIGGRVGIRSGDGRWDLSAFAQNLTNQYYRTIVFAGVLQPGTFNAYVGEPRSWGVELRARF